MAVIKLEPGGYYRIGSSKGLRPVDVFVVQIDEPADLDYRVAEPIISMVMTSSRPGMPILGFAPFYMSAMLDEGAAALPPWDLKGIDGAANYRKWRADWDAGEAAVWDRTPAEVYRQVIESMVASSKMIRRPN